MAGPRRGLPLPFREKPPMTQHANPVADTAVHGPVPTIETVGLTKVYGQNAALDHVSLRFLPGEVHVLFGENGAGKSTLISMISGA